MFLTSACVYLQHNHKLPAGEHASGGKTRSSPPSHDSCPLKLSCRRFSAAYMINLTLGGAPRLYSSPLIKWNEPPCDRKQVAAALARRAALIQLCHYSALLFAFFFILSPLPIQPSRLPEKATADLVNSVMSTLSLSSAQIQYNWERREEEEREKRWYETIMEAHSCPDTCTSF